jgi:integrase
VAQGDLLEMTLDNYGRLAQALGPANSAFMWLGAETGLRWGECAAITLGDLDLDLGAATLNVALQLDRDQQLSPTKNKASGTIDLSEATVAGRSEHLERNGLVGGDPTTLIFSTAKGNRRLHYSSKDFLTPATKNTTATASLETSRTASIWRTIYPRRLARWFLARSEPTGQPPSRQFGPSLLINHLARWIYV